MASSMDTEPRFQCILTPDAEPLYFDQEVGKKSSFLLNLDDAAGAISQPTHVCITCSPKDKFLFGGLELISNARNVEVYLTDQDDKEAYLTTCRGIVAGDNADAPYTFKCLVVCPGGPRPVLRVRLKLLSLKPPSCTSATLHLIKLKGRLPPPKQQQEATTDSSTSRQVPAQTNNTQASPALTQADMGTAMAGVSVLVRSVESSLLQSVQSSLDRIEKKFDERFNRIEQYLMLQQQQALIQQQQQQERYNTLQSQLMLQMKEQQNEVVSLIGSLQVWQMNQQQPLDKETDATTDKMNKEVQSETIKEAKIVDHGNGEQVVSEGVKSPSVSREESREPENELVTDNANEATPDDEVSTETTEQDVKGGATEFGALSEAKEQKSVEDESCADQESESEGYGNASALDSNDEVDEREDSVAEKANVGTNVNVNLADLNADQVADPPVQSDDAPIFVHEEIMKVSDETPAADQSDDTPNEGKQSRTDHSGVGSASQNTPKSASNSSSSQPEKQTIMNQRADAWEIPDLLSDATVNEVTATVPDSSLSIEHRAQDEVS